MLNQFIVPCKSPTVASCPTYRFLRKLARWSGAISKNSPQFVVMHIVKGFSVVNKAEIVVFFFFNSLAFFYDPMDVGNLISGSSAFCKSSVYIWTFFSFQVKYSQRLA